MQITVNLFATFREGRFDTAATHYPEGTAVRGVVAELHIPERELGIVLVNGRHAAMEQALTGGDTLSLFPLVGGG